jgi:hypothetical protein
MNDDILDAVRDSAAPVRMDRPLDAIEARARALRRQRTLTGAAALTVTAGLALTLALSAVGAARPPSAGTATVGAPSGQQLQPVGFTLVVSPDDTVTVTFQEVITDPTVLEKALADVGVPAKVWLNKMCFGKTWSGGPADWVSHAIRYDKVGPGGQPTLTIRRTTVPKGVTLSLGFMTESGKLIASAMTNLATDEPLTCATMAR